MANVVGVVGCRLTLRTVTPRQIDRAAQLVDILGVAAYRDVKRALGLYKPFQLMTYDEAMTVIAHLESAWTIRIETARALAGGDLQGN